MNFKTIAKREPLLPEQKIPSLGRHNPRVPDRSAMNAILFVLRAEGASDERELW